MLTKASSYWNKILRLKIDHIQFYIRSLNNYFKSRCILHVTNVSSQPVKIFMQKKQIL